MTLAARHEEADFWNKRRRASRSVSRDRFDPARLVPVKSVSESIESKAQSAVSRSACSRLRVSSRVLTRERATIKQKPKLTN